MLNREAIEALILTEASDRDAQLVEALGTLCTEREAAVWVAAKLFAALSVLANDFALFADAPDAPLANSEAIIANALEEVDAADPALITIAQGTIERLVAIKLAEMR